MTWDAGWAPFWLVPQQINLYISKGVYFSLCVRKLYLLLFYFDMRLFDQSEENFDKGYENESRKENREIIQGIVSLRLIE